MEHTILTLRARREALSLSQEDLARIMGVTVTTISRWERGSGTLKPYQWTAWDNALRRAENDAQGHPEAKP